MKCPRCESTILDERDRDGVTIDVCPKCRGIWLDRGELERLIARAMDEQSSLESQGAESRHDRDHRDSGRDRHHDDHDHDHHGHGDYRRKRSWFDIFD